jgi:GDP-4-dehydro-6-deoxy-D-mannose reductase
MRILITGACGFLGTNLIDYLKFSGGYTIFSIDKTHKKTELINDNVQCIECDLIEVERLSYLMNKIEPDVIIHLAGVIFSENMDNYIKSNVLCSSAIFTVASKLKNKPFVINIGSASQYGNFDCELGEARESYIQKPLNAYGLSKKMQEDWFLGFIQRKEIKGCSVRIFNVIGKGQHPELLPMSFIRQIHGFKNNKNGFIEVGDLDAYRDFVDIRDITRAFKAIIDVKEQVSGQIFNLASGTSICIGDLLDLCLKLGGYDRTIVKVNQKLLSKIGTKKIVGNIEKIQTLTGWYPKITCEQSINYLWGNYEV